MNYEKRYIHLFYGIMPIMVYFGIAMILIDLASMFQWDNYTVNLINGIVTSLVLYFFCFRMYNKRGGTREVPPLFPWKKSKKDEFVPDKKEDGVLPNGDSTTQLGRERETRIWKMPIKGYVWVAILGAAGGIALNNWFAILGLFQKIMTYDKVAESIYYGSIWMIFIRTAILAPIMEELLVRGLFYRGISCVLGRIPGMVISALIFAIMHGNLLQGMYAFILGILFAYVYDMSGRNILAPILAHFTANIISVLGTSVGAVSGFFAEYFYILTGLTTILMVIAVVELYTCKKRRLDDGSI